MVLNLNWGDSPGGLESPVSGCPVTAALDTPVSGEESARTGEDATHGQG